jgi:hypothetical protein
MSLCLTPHEPCIPKPCDRSSTPTQCRNGTASVTLGAKDQSGCIPSSNIDYDALIDMTFCTASAANTRLCQSDAAAAALGEARVMVEVRGAGFRPGVKF